jgi:hypothetical protein
MASSAGTELSRWGLVAACALFALALTGCGEEATPRLDASEVSDTASPSVTASESQSATPAPGRREPILIKTRVVGFEGEVVTGSIIGDVPFCPEGIVRHEPGSPAIGYPAINVIECADGQLQIGFGPGPDQMNEAVQTSGWEILEGTGRFAGASGPVRMRVRGERVGAAEGQELFKGQITIP